MVGEGIHEFTHNGGVWWRETHMTTQVRIKGMVEGKGVGGWGCVEIVEKRNLEVV
jgi:hypothetical protein